MSNEEDDTFRANAFELWAGDRNTMTKQISDLIVYAESAAKDGYPFEVTGEDLATVLAALKAFVPVPEPPSKCPHSDLEARLLIDENCAQWCTQCGAFRDSTGGQWTLPGNRVEPPAPLPHPNGRCKCAYCHEGFVTWGDCNVHERSCAKRLSGNRPAGNDRG